MPNKERSKKLLESGRCVRCGGVKDNGKAVCQSCIDNSSAYIKKRRLQRIEMNLCTGCGERPPEPDRKKCQKCSNKDKSWCDKNRHRIKSYCESRKSQNLLDRQNRKQRIFDHYGTKCLCCGEYILLLLTIDHIHENGAEHRRQVFPNRKDRTPGGDNFYRWLEKNQYPDGFQTLCYNCNIGKYRNGGVCPHQYNRKCV